jgi:hypothetical protein
MLDPASVAPALLGGDARPLLRLAQIARKLCEKREMVLLRRRIRHSLSPEAACTGLITRFSSVFNLILRSFCAFSALFLKAVKQRPGARCTTKQRGTLANIVCEILDQDVPDGPRRLHLDLGLWSGGS